MARSFSRTFQVRQTRLHTNDGWPKRYHVRSAVGYTITTVIVHPGVFRRTRNARKRSLFQRRITIIIIIMVPTRRRGRPGNEKRTTIPCTRFAFIRRRRQRLLVIDHVICNKIVLKFFLFAPYPRLDVVQLRKNAILYARARVHNNSAIPRASSRYKDTNVMATFKM